MTNTYCPRCGATYRQSCCACGMVYVPRKNGDHFWVDRRTSQRYNSSDGVWALEAKMVSAEEIDRGSRRIASPQFSTVTSTDLAKYAVSAGNAGAAESFRAELQDALQFFQAQQDNSAIYKQINDALTSPMCLSCEVKPRWSEESRCVDCQRDYKKKEAQRTARREAEQRRKSMQAAERKAELLRMSREALLEQKVKELNRGFEDFRHYVKNGEIHRSRVRCAECGISVNGSKRCIDCQEDAQLKAKMEANCDPCGSDVVRQELADAMANRDVTEAKDASIPSWDPLNAAPMLHWLPTPPEPEVFPRFAGGDKMTVALGVAMALGSLLMAGLMVLMGLWWAAPAWIAPTLYCVWMERTDRQAKIQRYYDAIHRRATADWENGRHEVLKEHQS